MKENLKMEKRMEKGFFISIQEVNTMVIGMMMK